MASVGSRLQEERKRLKISQAEFGKIGGCGRTTQIRYESDEGSPTLDYLDRIGDAGADIIYIVSGERSGKARYESPLEAMQVVIEVQEELKLKLEAEQIRNLTGLTYSASLDREQLKAVVLGSYQLDGIDIGTPSESKQ